MRLLRRKKFVVPAIVGVLALVGAGVAYGYFTSSGTGNGSAPVGTASDLTITQLGPLYSSLVSPAPQDMFSEAFEATGSSEFGNEVNLTYAGHALSGVVVTMSSFVCESGSGTNCTTTPGDTFAEPITLTIYKVGADNTLGSVIATDTQTFKIPFRPSADNTNCLGPNLDNPTAGAGEPNGEWYNGTTCSADYNSNITFSGGQFSPANPTLPATIIYGISYNTSDFGTTPYGDSTACHATTAGCGYDGLNVAVTDDTGNAGTTNITAGSDAVTGDFLASTEAVSYCNGDPEQGTGPFQYDPYSLPCSGATSSAYSTSSNAIDNPPPGGTFDGYPTLDYTTGFWVPAVEFDAANIPLAPLYPGGPADPVDFSITNPGNSSVLVTSVTDTYSIAPDLAYSSYGTCYTTWFGNVPPTSPADLEVLPGTTIFLPSGGSIALNAYDTNQDACEGATVNLVFTSS